MKKFNQGIKIQPLVNPLGFKYGKDCFGPEVEQRTLDLIRKSLLDPHCSGPEIVYSIAIVAFIFIWKFIPETKGKTLEEMESFWGFKNGSKYV